MNFIILVAVTSIAVLDSTGKCEEIEANNDKRHTDFETPSNYIIEEEDLKRKTGNSEEKEYEEEEVRGAEEDDDDAEKDDAFRMDDGPAGEERAFDRVIAPRLNGETHVGVPWEAVKKVRDVALKAFAGMLTPVHNVENKFYPLASSVRDTANANIFTGKTYEESKMGYKSGDNYWAGTEIIHDFTTTDHCHGCRWMLTLFVEWEKKLSSDGKVVDDEKKGQWAIAWWPDFKVLSEAAGYALSFGALGESLNFHNRDLTPCDPMMPHRYMKFSAHDKDQSLKKPGSCTSDEDAYPYWYNGFGDQPCATVNLLSKEMSLIEGEPGDDRCSHGVYYPKKYIMGLVPYDPPPKVKTLRSNGEQYRSEL